jgi:hypothetical protein
VRDRAHEFIADHPEYGHVADLPVLAKLKRPSKTCAA